MAVFHITIHGYRTWSPGNRRGYVKPGKGILPSDPKMAWNYDRDAKQPPAVFDDRVQRVMIRSVSEICSRREWRMHAMGTETTHFHLLMSWKQYASAARITQVLKNVLSYLLNKEFKSPGRRWFVRNESKRQVKNLDHFKYLVTEYLPNHSGVFWKEGQPLPT